MAVEDKYIETSVAAGEQAPALFVQGEKGYFAVATFEVAAADDDGSVYRLLKGLPSRYVPIKIEINADAITGSTDWDLGLYESELGAVIDKDCFMDGTDLSSGAANGSEVNGLSAVNIADLTKTLYEHAAHTISTKKSAYDLALTANTVGSAAGTVTARVYFGIL